MNDWRLEDAFAPVPDVVQEHIDKAIMEVHNMNQKHRKPMLAVALIVVLALALGSTAVATSTQWGIFDFFSWGSNKGQALPEASDALRTDVTQQGGKMEAATFTLRETLCDGRYAWLAFDVIPSDAHTLLLTWDDSIYAPANDYSPELPKDMTLQKWAQENGYYRIMRVDMYAQEREPWQNASWHRQADGSYTVLMMKEFASAEGSDLAFTCVLYPIWDITSSKQTREQRATVTVTLEPSIDPLWTEEWTGETAIPDTDIVIERVTLTGTAIATYVEIVYTASEIHWLYPRDENDKRMLYSLGIVSNTKTGIMTTSHMYQLDKGRYVSAGLYTALPEPLESLRIGGMHRTTNERLESIVISFH